MTDPPPLTPGKGDGNQLELSLADQLHLGRVLHRFLSADTYKYAVLTCGGKDGPPDWLRLDDEVTVERQEEIDAILRAIGTTPHHHHG